MSKCPACGHEIRDRASTSEGILHELVELKRVKDTVGETTDYTNRKRRVWREAFAFFNVFAEPKE